ncbi:DUF3667 domain-containing protein [uncultured Flavobacterium sp.]|uniref:DUF3667 domain-containing protein n=1 Tax=uncultured Flavobacterium sp. TaxID=165435 RepID=UPI0030ED59F8|tara:strand:- start:953 stop:2014 length:1062 start_codon:yes stop_codon:yes gene_type:complete
MSKKKLRQYRGTKCLNCETALDISEKYCHQCGQLNSTKKLTIKDFFEEFLSNFYAYDSRLRNSIISIFTEPGILAKEFNEGKRQKYANPFRFFLSVSIVLFITFNLSSDDSTDININNNKNLEQKNDISNDSIKLETDLVKLDLESVDKSKKINYSKDSIYTEKELNKNQNGQFYRLSSFKNYHTKNPEKNTDESLKELKFENSRINKFLFNKAKLLKTDDVNKEILDYFYQKLPFLIFLSLPIITIIFWLVYIRKKINYTEHLVFSYTYFTFMFICMIVFNLIDLISPNLSNIMSALCFLIFFPIYFYKSLRNFYQQSRWKTILKFVILNPLFGLFLLISATIMMFIGILLF